MSLGRHMTRVRDACAASTSYADTKVENFVVVISVYGRFDLHMVLWLLERANDSPASCDKQIFDKSIIM